MPDKGPAEYQLLGELFTRASQLAPAEMQRMLCDVARDAPELHADLVRLLQEDECIDTAADPFHDVASLNAHPSVNTSALIPERIGQFEIVRKIAEGGMGAVYEAVRTGEYEQRVAIKLLKQGCNRQELVRRFADEVQFLAVLGEHTKIAGLLDAGTTQAGIPYLVMQFVDGEAIDRYCDRHRLTVQQRLDLFLDACDAVQFAHQHTVIHRDLKPSNILVTDQGMCQLIDFGIAKLLTEGIGDRTTVATQTEFRVMTPQYASPEQIRGTPLTTTSDVYSLGVILYELLTGQRPFKIDSHEPSAASRVIESRQPAKPSQIRGELAGDLDNIVLMALRDESDRRYVSVTQFATDIRRYLDGRPVIARKDTFAYRCSKFIRRNQVASIAAVLIAISLAGGAIGVTTQWIRAERSAVRAKWEQYRANVAAAARELETGNNASVGRLLEKSPDELRGWEWDYLNSQRDMSVRELSGTHQKTSNLVFSPVGFRLATVTDHHSIQIWDVDTLQPFAELTGHSDGIRQVLYNVDATRLVTLSSDQTVRLWDASDGQSIAILGETGYTRIAVSPNGKTVAAAGVDGSISLWDTDDGTPAGLAIGHSSEINDIAFRPDGRQFATASYDRTIRLWDIGEIAEPIVLRGHDGPVQCIAYSRDGSRLASGGATPDTSVIIWDLVGDDESVRGSGHRGTISVVRFSPDGTRVVSGSEDQTARLWDAKDASVVALLRGHRGAIRDVQFEPSGQLFATASQDSTVRFWNTRDANLISVLRGHTGSVNAIAFNATTPIRLWNSDTGKPDAALQGRQDVMDSLVFNSRSALMATSASDGTIRLWNRKPGLRDGVMAGHTSAVRHVTLSPDDSMAASISRDGHVIVWNLVTRQQIRNFHCGESKYVASGFSRDGQSLFCGTERNELHCWSIASRTRCVIGDECGVVDELPAEIAFSRDRRWAAVIDAESRVVLHDADRGGHPIPLSVGPSPITGFSFFPHNRALLVCSDQNRLFRVDLQSRAVTPLGVLDFHARTLAFNSDGSLVAATGKGDRVSILETDTWTEVVSLLSPSYVHSIAFCPDQSRLACGCRDNAIRLWDTKTWRFVAELTGHEHAVETLAFTHDGTRIVSGSSDHSVRVWDTLSQRERLDEQSR